MTWLITKYLITSAIVVAVSEIAKRSDRLGALLAALPMVTILALIWLYVEDQPTEKIANHAYYTFWYVLPTLPMFLVFPMLLARIGFWPTLLACALITIALFAVLSRALAQFGIHLLRACGWRANPRVLIHCHPINECFDAVLYKENPPFKCGPQLDC